MELDAALAADGDPTAPAGHSGAPAVAAVDHPFHFRGDAREYFRIWIVNLALTVVTLGVFSAWAKVRRERYFYGNTWVGGAPFQYLANPLNILKGRAIAAVVLTAYVLLGQFVILAQLGLLLVLMIAAPWLILLALRFRARYSAWNTLTFRFTGRLGSAVNAYLLMWFLMVPTIGLIYPQLRATQRRFVTNGHRFGGTPFALHARSSAFYEIFGKALVLALVTGGLCFAVVSGVSALIGEAIVKLVTTGTYVRYSTFAVLYPTAFVVWTYTSSAITNLSYNTTTLGLHQFRSTLRARDLAGIYVTNGLAILGSAGLLIPWAQIRLARYRAEHLLLVANGDLLDLAAQAGDEQRAFGSETASFFDLDISL